MATDNDGAKPEQQQEPTEQPTIDPNETTESDGGTFPADYVKSLRAEAADRRRQLREAESRILELESAAQKAVDEKLEADRKWQELAEKRKAENEKLKEDMERARLESLRLKLGNEYGLPTELVERLQGTTEAELRKDAEALGEIFKQQPRRQTTTALPGGAPAGETDEQKRRRLFQNKSDVWRRS